MVQERESVKSIHSRLGVAVALLDELGKHIWCDDCLNNTYNLMRSKINNKVTVIKASTY